MHVCQSIQPIYSRVLGARVISMPKSYYRVGYEENVNVRP